MDVERLIESESRKLSDFYYPYYMEERYPGAMKNFTTVNINSWKNKIFFAYKKYFEKVARMFCVRDGFNAEKFIKAIMLDGFKTPQQMCNEKVWETYLNYVPAIQSQESNDRIVVKEIVSAALELKRYNGLSEWLKRKTNQISVLQKQINFSPLLLAFSSSFIDFCNVNGCELYNFPLIRERVFELKESEKVLNKIKDFLKEDYYSFEEDKLVKELNAQGLFW